MTDPTREDLLVEIGCEELPPKVLAKLTESFFDQVCAGLEEAHIGFDGQTSRYLYSPRRMSLIIASVEDRQPDRQQDRRGPALSAAYDSDGNPTKAAQGFARSVNQPVDALQTLKTDKGEWLHCRIDLPGQPLSELLFDILQSALEKLPVPKPMRWGAHEYSFVRPVHWIVVLHGNQVVRGELYGCVAGNLTRGHRIHAPGPHPVESSSEYLDVLHNASVEADQELRREAIRQKALAAGEQMGGQTRITDELLEEVSNLLEWPSAISCTFDEAFLQVPQEALIASMEEHQKFFPVMNKETGELTPAFVAMANIDSKNPAAVREGFERVVTPRLADARFFWQQDLKSSLESLVPALDNIVYQKDLGTVGDKSRRVMVLSKTLADIIGEHSATPVRAAQLAKADLVSLMVGEFPELQGTMGTYYARESGEDESVATAIGSHYHPRFAGDEIPADSAGRILALADRLDTLVGIFAAGLKPTGNKDPFALRRAALGVIRILQEGGVNLSLDELLAAAAEGLQSAITVDEDTLADVRKFMLERLRNFLLDQGFSANQVKSVLAAPLNTMTDLNSRLSALAEFMRKDSAISLVAANKRIGNILKKQEGGVVDNISEDVFSLDEERVLFTEVNNAERTVAPLFDKGDYSQALEVLASLKRPVDDYFESVMVMDEDPVVRLNRLAQLKKLKGLFDRVADFSLAD